MEKNFKDADLHSMLDNITTQKKTPSEINNFQSQNNSPFWDQFGKEDKKESQESEQAQVEQAPAKNPDFKKEDARASANMLIKGIDGFQTLMFSLIIESKYKKKFTEEEIERVYPLTFLDKKDIKDPKDIAIFNKYEVMMKRRDKKLGKIPFDEKLENDFAILFTDYQVSQQKVFSPVISLIVGCMGLLGKRIYDTFSGD